MSCTHTLLSAYTYTLMHCDITPTPVCISSELIISYILIFYVLYDFYNGFLVARPNQVVYTDLISKSCTLKDFFYYYLLTLSACELWSTHENNNFFSDKMAVTRSSSVGMTQHGIMLLPLFHLIT